MIDREYNCDSGTSETRTPQYCSDSVGIQAKRASSIDYAGTVILLCSMKYSYAIIMSHCLYIDSGSVIINGAN